MLVALGGFAQIAASYWDLASHMMNGREGFFTNPHVAIMAGGMLCFMVAFWLHQSTRKGSKAAAHVIAGTRAIMWAVNLQFISFGIDEVWHRTLGSDSFIWSPPHILIISGCAFSTAAFASLVNRLRDDVGGGALAGILRGVTLFTWLFLISEAEFRYAHSSEGLWHVHPDQVHPHISPLYAMLITGPFVLAVLSSTGRGQGRLHRLIESLLTVGTYTGVRWLTVLLLSATPLSPVGPPLVLLAAVPYILLNTFDGPRWVGAALFVPILWGSELLFGTYLARGVMAASWLQLAGSWLLTVVVHELARRELIGHRKNTRKIPTYFAET